MRVGVLKEIKTKENRVAMTPSGVEQMRLHGHEVLLESHAGDGSVFSDEEYIKAGAVICNTPKEIYQKCQMIMKVKEPLPVEYPMIRNEQVLFTFFHFAASLDLTRAIIDSRSVAVAYETVERENGSLPLLMPMSEVAGKMAIQEGAKYLEKTFGGKGVLLGGVPGVDSGTVLIIGGGTVGTNAAKIACGLGAKVYLLDNNLERLRYLSDIMPKNCFPIMSSPATIRRLLKKADLVVGAVLIPGAVAPKLITRDMLILMKKGSVIVDINIDQGGCVETSECRTHKDPVFEKHGVVHYSVSNIPSRVARTASIALSNVFVPILLELGESGGLQAHLKENKGLRKGVYLFNGILTNSIIGNKFGILSKDIDLLLAAF